MLTRANSLILFFTEYWLMMITDACVFPRPFGDSSVRRMALEARELGFDSLVAIDAKSCEYAGITVSGGIIIREMPVQEVSSRIRRSRKEGAVAFVQAGDNRFNRTVLGMRGVQVLCGVHGIGRNSFDHVAAKTAADNCVAIDISLKPVIRCRGAVRQKALDRYLDIVALYRRFDFPLLLSSHAKSVLEMRSVREFTALASIAGLDIPDVERALANAGRIHPPEPAVRVIP
jgi:ribonuclease P/MRP protein subunit RPP1